MGEMMEENEWKWLTKGKVTNFEKKYIYIRKKDEYFEILIEKFSQSYHIYDGEEYGITEYERIRYKKI